MRAKEFLFENISQLKNKITDLVNSTRDEILLNKIYAVLNQDSLVGRLSTELESMPDREIQSFNEEIATAIIQSSGTYEEKIAFVEGLSKGFIDVEKMTDGNRHHFADILKPTNKVPLKFLFDMFNSLKNLGSRVKKGPGEFAIAIMSPKVSIFGGGDLKIDGKNVEVKAGYGTIGATALFQHQEVPNILQKYFPNIDLNQNIGPTVLSRVIKSSNLDTATLKQFADELVNYIFSQHLNYSSTDSLKRAIVDVKSSDQAENIRKGYLIAAYTAYKRGKESKFDGIMLMNFERQELRYFDDPEKLYTDIEKPQFNFYSKNIEWGGKLISPQVQLRAQQLVKPEVPSQYTPDSLQQYIQQRAEYLVKSAQQRNPQDLDLRDPKLIDDVAAAMSEIVTQFKGSRRIEQELFKKFPMLKVKRKEADGTQPAAPAMQKQVQPVTTNIAPDQNSPM